jgi:hypothetical protein
MGSFAMVAELEVSRLRVGYALVIVFWMVNRNILNVVVYRVSRDALDIGVDIVSRNILLIGSNRL